MKKFYRYIFHTVLYTENGDYQPFDLDEIARDSRDVNVVSTTFKEGPEEIAPKQLADTLVAMCWEPRVLGINRDGTEYDIEDAS